jgi:hypothetical protein
MEWYVLKVSTGDDIGKKYPQTDGMRIGYDFNKPNSIWNLHTGEFPDFEPDLDYFVLSSSAKLTDVISTGLITATGFIVSDKVKNIFNQFNLPAHKYYPTSILHKKVLHNNYFWLHFGEDNINLIDFKKSSFALKHPLPFFQKQVTAIKGLNLKEIIDMKSEHSPNELFPDNIKFVEVVNKSMLFFSFLWDSIYINSQLRDSLVNGRVTGLEIKPSELTTIL